MPFVLLGVLLTVLSDVGLGFLNALCMSSLYHLLSKEGKGSCLTLNNLCFPLEDKDGCRSRHINPGAMGVEG